MLIDGKKIAATILEDLKKEIREKNLQPKLAIILVGANPASVSYVNQKMKRGEEIGTLVEVFKFPETISVEEVKKQIIKLNQDKSVSGIIIQLPLPMNFDQNELLNLVISSKDVDGLGTLSPFKPATPLAVMELLKRSEVLVKNKKVVVIGASDLVGKPVSSLLTQEDGLVTLIDINTPNPEAIIKEADILVVAIGVPKYVTPDMVKNGVVVIDVGITKTEEGLVGDVDFENVSPVASLITPVPGGVGPMTVAMLLSNVVRAAQ